MDDHKLTPRSILSSPRLLAAGLPQLSQNEALVMAGTLHGIHAITGKLSPVDGRGEGVEVIEGDGVKMILFLTGTGTSMSSSCGPVLQHPMIYLVGLNPILPIM